MQAFRKARRRGLERAVPVAGADVGRQHHHPVLAGVAHQLGRGVESHRLAVEQDGAEHLRIEALDPGRDVDQLGEGGRVALGEAVFAEAPDLVEAAAGEVRIVAALDHAADHHLLVLMDGAHVAEGGHGAPEAVGLVAGELGRHHGDLHRVLLEQRHAEGLAEHLLQFVLIVFRIGPREIDPVGFAPRLGLALLLARLQVGMDHAALDRAGAHDRHLHHQIVEFARAQARQHGHLRPALHLEGPHRVRQAQHVVDLGILLRQVLEGERDAVPVLAVMLVDQGEALADGGQHAERQDVDLHDAERVDVVLVPLDEGAVGHGGVAHRHGLHQRRLGQDEAAHVLRQVAREAYEFLGQFKRQLQAGTVAVQARALDVVLRQALAPGAPHRAGQGGGHVLGQAQRLAHVADRRTRAIADLGGADGGAVAAVTFIDVLDHLLAPLVLEVDVDVGRLAPLLRKEALEQHVLLGRVDRGDAQAEAHHRIGRRAAPLTEDALAARPGDDVVHGQEVVLVLHMADQLELLAEGLDHRPRDVAAPDPPGAGHGQIAQVLRGRLAGRDRLVGVLVAQGVETEGGGLDDLARALQGVLVALEQPRHLRADLQMPFGVGLQPIAGFVDGHAMAHAGQHVLQPAPFGDVVEGAVAGDHGRARPPAEFVQGVEPRLVVPAVERGDEKVEPVWPGLAPGFEPRLEGGVRFRRGRDQGDQPLAELDRLFERQPALALADRLEAPLASFPDGGRVAVDLGLADGQQAAEAPVGSPVAGVDDQLGPVRELQPGAGQDVQRLLLALVPGAHDPGQAVAVGHAQGLQPQHLRLHHQLARPRGALQETVVRPAIELGEIGGVSLHPQAPWIHHWGSLVSSSPSMRS